MQAIIDFFTSILDIIMSLLQLVVTFLQSVVWLIGNLPQLIAGATAGFAYAPTFMLPFLTASLAVLVVIFLVRLM